MAHVTTHGGDTPRARGDKDAPHMTAITPAEDVRTVLINNISWGAVFAGIAISLVTQLLLNMLGIGIGAATINPATGDNPSVTTFSLGAAFWWTVSGIIAAFLGGHAAGRLSGRPKESTAGWHGLTTWAVTTIIVFFLLTSTIGAVVGGALGAVKSTVGGVGRAALETAAPAVTNTDVFGDVERQIRERSGGTDPQALRDAAVSAMRAVVLGDQTQADAARERAAEALARAQNISTDEARAQVTQYEQQYRQAAEQAKQKATQAAEAATDATAKGALFGFLALLLGAIAAWFGGRMGAVEPTMTADAEVIPARRQV
jgi:hypothetical protein